MLQFMSLFVVFYTFISIFWARIERTLQRSWKSNKFRSVPDIFLNSFSFNSNAISVKPRSIWYVTSMSKICQTPSQLVIFADHFLVIFCHKFCSLFGSFFGTIFGHFFDLFLRHFFVHFSCL